MKHVRLDYSGQSMDMRMQTWAYRRCQGSLEFSGCDSLELAMQGETKVYLARVASQPHRIHTHTNLHSFFLQPLIGIWDFTDDTDASKNGKWRSNDAISNASHHISSTCGYLLHSYREKQAIFS
jgi:hypothetical protein